MEKLYLKFYEQYLLQKNKLIFYFDVCGKSRIKIVLSWFNITQQNSKGTKGFHNFSKFFQAYSFMIRFSEMFFQYL